MRDFSRRLAKIEAMRPAHDVNVEAMRQRIAERLDGIRERLTADGAPVVPICELSPIERIALGQLDIRAWLAERRADAPQGVA